MSKRAIIFCWSESSRMPSDIFDDDYIICADSGSEYAARLGIKPDLCVGDFDSSKAPENVETILLPSEKDDTDAVSAAKKALSMGFTKIVIAGGMGGRLDHTLGAIATLVFIENHGTECVMCDGFTRVSLIRAGAEKTFPYSEKTKYISIFPSDGRSSGVDIKGLKYPLDNYDLRRDSAVCVSNEPVAGVEGKIKAGDGDLIAVEILR